MKVAIDAVGIRGHGGAAVLCELLHWLPIMRPGWDWHVFLFERSLREFDDPAVSEKVTLEHVALGDNGRQRLEWVNQHLPARVRNLNADTLFSFANIAPVEVNSPKIVFCHQSNAFFGEGIPLSTLFKRARLWFMRRQILRGARASRALIVQTDTMRERIEQVEPNLKGRIYVIPSGYRTPPEKPAVREEVRQAIESASHPRLIYVSHPSEHKNHLALVKALPLIVRQKPTARLLFTLDQSRLVNGRYNGFVHQIQAEAEHQGVAEHVVWLGQLTPDEVDFALRSSDMMVFPSLAESFGLGLVEAMAAGCPIAAADLPYAHDVCGDAAIYFDPKDPNAIAQAVITVCESKTEATHLRSLGLERKKRFSYETIAEEIARVLERAPAVTFPSCVAM